MTKIKSFFAILLVFLVSFAFIVSCKKKDKDKDPGPEFDRQAMLVNIGENIIIPNYQVLKTKTEALNTAVTLFNTTPDNTNLLALQDAFKEAYKAWQSCSVFEFGPADTEVLRISVNTFPTDTVQIKSNISSGSYSLGAASNIDAKGLPGIDYLLFGIGADNNAILDMYVSDAEAANRKTYLAALSGEINTKVATVLNAWSTSGGNYLNTFINASGTDAGSSLGQLVNQFNYDYEIIKTNKIGIPLGKKTLGTILPAKVEAYYSGISVELALDQIRALENVYLGRSSSGVDGLGLDDYLVFLSAPYNGGLLSEAIKSQISTAIVKLQAVPDPLSATVVNNQAVVEAAYVELQKTIILIKTDMPSAMGVLITYQDNDGD